jgi:multicomponent Na+:H+ antiporter subunit G
MNYLTFIIAFLILLGVIFMLIASLGIVRLPDFYMRMSAITKAATLGLGLVLVAASIHFDDFGVIAKSFIIITFMLLTGPVGAHAISRAAYKQEVGFWGKTIIDELGNMVQLAKDLQDKWARDKNEIEVGERLIEVLLSLPQAQGGSFKQAIKIGKELEQVHPETGHRMLGIIYGKMGNDKVAEQYLFKSCQEGFYSNKTVFAMYKFYVDRKLYQQCMNLMEKALLKHTENYDFLLETAHLSYDHGIRMRFGLECAQTLCQLSKDDVPAEHQLVAARYKRYLTKKIGKL